MNITWANCSGYWSSWAIFCAAFAATSLKIFNSRSLKREFIGFQTNEKIEQTSLQIQQKFVAFFNPRKKKMFVNRIEIK
jgi:hypothetical protein